MMPPVLHTDERFILFSSTLLLSGLGKTDNESFYKNIFCFLTSISTSISYEAAKKI